MKSYTRWIVGFVLFAFSAVAFTPWGSVPVSHTFAFERVSEPSIHSVVHWDAQHEAVIAEQRTLEAAVNALLMVAVFALVAASNPKSVRRTWRHSSDPPAGRSSNLSTR